MTFVGMGHIALRVNDLERSLAFYGKLGFPEFLRLTQEDGRTWIAYLRVSDSLFIELFPGGDGSDVPGPESVGIAATSPLVASRRGVDGNRGMWIADPDGNRIEIMEMAADCVQYEALKAVQNGEPPHVLVRPI